MRNPQLLPHKWFDFGGRRTVKYFFLPSDTLTTWYWVFVSSSKQKLVKTKPSEMFQRSSRIFFASWVELSMKHFFFYFHRCCMQILTIQMFNIIHSLMRGASFFLSRKTFYRCVIFIGSQLHAPLPMDILCSRNINYRIMI